MRGFTYKFSKQYAIAKSQIRNRRLGRYYSYRQDVTSMSVARELNCESLQSINTILFDIRNPGTWQNHAGVIVKCFGWLNMCMSVINYTCGTKVSLFKNAWKQRSDFQSQLLKLISKSYELFCQRWWSSFFQNSFRNHNSNTYIYRYPDCWFITAHEKYFILVVDSHLNKASSRLQKTSLHFANPCY